MSVAAGRGPHRRSLLAAHLAILPAGAAQALYGPSLPAVAERFGSTVGTVGILIGTHGAGSFAGILLWLLLQRRLGLQRVAAAATLLLASGAVLLATAPNWPLMLTGAVLTGAGFGGVSIGTNTYMSRLLGARAAPALALLAALFGIGAIGAPAVLGVLGPERHPIVFLTVAGVALVAGPLLAAGDPAYPAATVGRAGRPSPAAWAFLWSLGLYAALEVSIGGWQATHLARLGYSSAAAAGHTAGFWAAFTIGRLLATPLASRISVVVLSLGAIVVATAALGVTLVGVGPVAVVAYLVAGVAMAPVFPATFAWFSHATGGAPGVTALFFLAGSVGSTLVPPVVGFAADRAGAVGIPLGLLTVGTACALSLARARSVTTPPPPPRRLRAAVDPVA